jgi:hypothetical protein
MLIQSLLYVGIIAVTRLSRLSLSKLFYNRRPEKNITFLLSMLKVATLLSVLASYTVPFFLIPRTIHPLLGWPLYLLGSAALNSIVINVFLLSPFAVFTTWIGLVGALLVMASPYYSGGVVRALAVFLYAFCYAPVAWSSLVKIMGSLQMLIDREAYFPRLGELARTTAEFTKLY